MDLQAHGDVLPASGHPDVLRDVLYKARAFAAAASVLFNAAQLPSDGYHEVPSFESHFMSQTIDPLQGAQTAQELVEVPIDYKTDDFDQTGPNAGPWFDTGDGQTVVNAFEDLKRMEDPDLEWTGSVDTCDAGNSSAANRDASIRAINFYRAMAGVSALVTEDEWNSQKAQEAALMMSVTGRLSHYPDESFGCYSKTGVEAAGNSNMYLGRTGPYAIHGYIEDPGKYNKDAGHRNIILHPPTERMGIGQVAGDGGRYPGNALWVFDGHEFDRQPVREPEGFVAWPPRGYIPEELAFYRWSFGGEGMDFENATITMTDENGRRIPLEILTELSPLEGYVPNPIIVWEPDVPEIHDNTSSLDGGDLQLEGYHAYTVEVNNVAVRGGVHKNISYVVEVRHHRQCRWLAEWGRLKGDRIRRLSFGLL